MSGMKRVTIQEVIDKLDLLRANAFPYDKKVMWLNDVDRQVWYEIYLTHEGLPPESHFDGYDQDTDPGTLLLVPEPYTDLYHHWLTANIDLATAESDKYEQDRELYNAAYRTFGDFWRRTHMPLVRRRHIRF